MKSIDNILKPLGERISSPLYSTFLISWCVSNWKIFFVTFIIPANHLSTSKLHYIELYIKDWCHMLLYPVGFTTAFIYVFPWIEKKVLTSWYKNKAERKQIIVEQMEKSPVSGEQHRNLLMRYVERETELTGFLERERNWFKEKEELTTKYNNTLEQHLETKNQAVGMAETIKRYALRSEAHRILEGRWKFTYKSTDDIFGQGNEYFYITPQNDYHLEDENQPKYKIVYFFYDELSERLYLLKQRIGDLSPEFLFNDLRKIDAVTYEGKEFGIIRETKFISKPNYVVYDVRYRKSGSDLITERVDKDVSEDFG